MSKCKSCGADGLAEGMDLCPMCEDWQRQAYEEYENEAMRDYHRQMEYEQWVSENGESGHGPGR